MHNPRLECFENGRMARTMSLKGGRTFIVGRNGAQADIVVGDSSVSRAHACIINSSSATFVHDLDSAHGTWYDEGGRTNHVPQLGVRLDPNAEPTKLVEGCTLRFGTHAALVFRVAGLEMDQIKRWQPPAWAARPSRTVHLEVRSNHVANPYLEHLAGGDIDEFVKLSSPCTVFGRSAAHAEVVVPDGSISRQHAAIVHTSEKQSYLIDLGSAGGSFIDGERASGEKPVLLNDGSVISFGACAATYTFRVGAAGGASGAQPTRGDKRKRA